MHRGLILVLVAACSSRSPAPGSAIAPVHSHGADAGSDPSTASAPLDALLTSVDAAAPNGPVTVDLHVAPPSITMANRNTLVLGYVVTNISSQTIDPGMRRAELRINGQPSIMFRNSNANGGFDSTWRALPPGQQLSRELRIGETLFDKPGDYTLELTVSGIVSAPVRIHVGS